VHNFAPKCHKKFFIALEAAHANLALEDCRA
jgi:hypothetical protein